MADEAATTTAETTQAAATTTAADTGKATTQAAGGASAGAAATKTADTGQTIAGGKVPPADKPGTIAEGGEVQTGEEVKGDFPDDWREKLAGGDEQLLKDLKRFGSPKGFAKSWREGRAQISKGALTALPEDATDEQKAEWRKARGVPDAPEGYEIAPPAGVEWTDEDKAVLGEFTKTAHGTNLSKDQAKSLAQWYIDTQAAREQEQNLAVQKYQITATKALRAEFGKDFDGTVEALKAYGQQTFTSKGWEEIVNSRMPNGAALGDNPVFVKFLADLALRDADGSPIELGSIKGGVSDADTKKAHATLISKAASGDNAAKAQLNDPDYEAKIRKVYEREAKAQSRAA